MMPLDEKSEDHSSYYNLSGGGHECLLLILMSLIKAITHKSAEEIFLLYPQLIPSCCIVQKVKLKKTLIINLWCIKYLYIIHSWLCATVKKHEFRATASATVFLVLFDS